MMNSNGVEYIINQVMKEIFKNYNQQQKADAPKKKDKK